MNRIKTLNENFFNEINDEKTAYFLGLIYADGNVIKSKKWESYSLSFCQSEKDKDIIIKLQNALETNRKITTLIYGTNKYYEISINSKKIFFDLEKYGVTPNKSLVLQFPTFIPDDLMPHFIRGYFDGDGSIWEGKRKKMVVKNERKPGTTRERIVHNVKFNFTGSNTFIPFLQEYLIKHCGFSKTKLNYSKSKEEHKYCYMEYSGRRNVYKLYKYMYSTATIFGERKYNKFKKIICDEKFKNIGNI